jgi:hypothetical protein
MLTSLKNFLLFAGDVYYPSGGWDDFQGSFDTVDEAKAYLKAQNHNHDWWQIVNLSTGAIEEEN